MPSCGVEGYEANRLFALVAEYSGEPAETFGDSVHAAYFREYFSELGAHTILVEDEYVDRDYLEDYAAYYVRCFHPYPRVCRRLHFLDRELTTEQLQRILCGDSELRERLAASYIGFIVVRPIPGYAIGRTCLRTYDSKGTAGTRCFPITRDYRANLQGIRLSLRSLAFQQQDRVVAACATAALWSAFHGTGMVFQHHIPSPIEITRSATAHFADETRTIPSSGLTTAQMADAVRACGLEPLMLRTKDDALLKGAAHAYLMGQIPVLMVGGLYLEGDSQDPSKELGVHAVTITGFGMGEAVADTEDLQLESARITKFYAHDDGVGPFARMEFLPSPDACAILSTSSAPSRDNIGSHVFRPEGLLVPLYHKIRVPYPTILAKVQQFHDLIAYLRRSEAEIPAVTWDIRLTTVNDYKSACLDDETLGDRRPSILKAEMPRYIWLARGRDETGSIDLLFDATGLETRHLCFRCLSVGTDLATWLAVLKDSLLDAARKFDCEEIIQQVLHSQAD